MTRCGKREVHTEVATHGLGGWNTSKNRETQWKSESCRYTKRPEQIVDNPYTRLVGSLEYLQLKARGTALQESFRARPNPRRKQNVTHAQEDRRIREISPWRINRPWGGREAQLVNRRPCPQEGDGHSRELAASGAGGCSREGGIRWRECRI
jgi:hypothetical protein